MKTLRVLIGAALIAGSGIASAVEPVEPIALNDAELDGVTAGLAIVFTGEAALSSATAVGGLFQGSLATTATGNAVTVTDIGGGFQITTGANFAAASATSSVFP